MQIGGQRYFAEQQFDVHSASTSGAPCPVQTARTLEHITRQPGHGDAHAHLPVETRNSRVPNNPKISGHQLRQPELHTTPVPE
jgi:hypothetical protein